MSPIVSSGELVAVGDMTLFDIRRPTSDTSSKTNGLPEALEAYRRWKNGVEARLEGDYAWAVWDNRRRKLHLGRDEYGARALYYAFAPGRYACFASAAGALSQGFLTTHVVDDSRIVEFLALMDDQLERTFYSGVRRVLPGCFVELTSSSHKSTTYWTPPTTRGEEHPGTAEIHVSRMRHALIESVRKRLAGTNLAGILASGGLDSSVLAAAVSTLGSPAHVSMISAIFAETPSRNEQSFARILARRYRLRHVQVSGDFLSPADGLESWFAAGGLPFTGLAQRLVANLFGKAAKLGLTTLLDGYGGDDILGYGTNQITELARHAKLIRAWHEAVQVASALDRKKRSVLAGRLLYPLLPASLVRVAKKCFRLATGQAVPSSTLMLNPHWISRFDVVGRLDHAASQRQMACTGQTGEQAYWLASKTFSRSLEIESFAAQLAGVTLFHPFMDQRVVHEAFAIPLDLRLQEGITRKLIRQSFGNELPRTNRCRPSKTDLGIPLSKAFKSKDALRLNTYIQMRRHSVWGYANRDVARVRYQHWLNKSEAPLDRGLWRTYILARWLDWMNS